jgi:hypothetical protein
MHLQPSVLPLYNVHNPTLERHGEFVFIKAASTIVTDATQTSHLEEINYAVVESVVGGD